MNLHDFNTLIKSRRSVFPKEYTGESVDDALIQQMLENANWAPTHKMTEPWRFIVFAGEGKIKLGVLQAEVYKNVTQADGTFKEERYKNLLSKPLESSHIILIYMKRDEKKAVREIEETGAVFCAIQNMYLTATAYGIGCYLSTGGITYFDEAKAAFDLNDEDRIIGFLHIGIPTHHDQPAKRTPAEHKVKWIK